MFFCARCTALVHKYRTRVGAFLADPPHEWMHAMGYDRNPVRFALECERWKHQVKQSCNQKQETDRT